MYSREWFSITSDETPPCALQRPRERDDALDRVGALGKIGHERDTHIPVAGIRAMRIAREKAAGKHGGPTGADVARHG